ncbi:MAG: DUF1289 domain-containing protein [Dongiaceae bacterium]
MSDPDTERLLARERRRSLRRQQLAGGPPSPCVSICRLDDVTGYCAGCFRTVDEIREWMIMMPDVRLDLLHRLDERKRAHIAAQEASRTAARKPPDPAG